jgi:hypothetical protein
MSTELEFFPIARRELRLDDPTAPRPVIVELARPVPHPNGDFACPFRIEGLGEAKTRYAAGIDEIQSLLLALRMIGAILYTSIEHQDGRLKWLDDDGSLGFLCHRIFLIFIVAMIEPNSFPLNLSKKDDFA